jgi:histidinol-phosphate aminotransferase
MSIEPLRLHRNEGRPPRGELFEGLSEAGPELARRYPEGEDVRDLLASRMSVPPECVLVTAGADDAIDRICRCWLGPGRDLLVHEPTFQMIPLYGRMTGARIVSVPDMWTDFPVEAMRGAVTEATGVAAVVTPNNPSGAAATAGDLAVVASALPPDAVLLVDAAYVEFADDDPTAAVLELPNVIVTRTLSKAWGLAGLRVGYAVSTPKIIERLQSVGSPYPVSTLALSLAARELESGTERMNEYVGRVRQERTRLQGLLEAWGLQPLPSQANFVFFRSERAEWIQAALSAVGVQVRRLESWPNGLRITCPGNPDDLARLERALDVVLAPQAILFDMDGVLADVSGSYRASIRATVESFGATVGDEEVDGLKAAGNHNDDWILTQEILADRGVDLPLEEVIQRFESFYQGHKGIPGLRSTETLLAHPDWIRSLADRFRLAVVTGRPRADAERFLEEQGIASAFEVVVAREDAPSKPDPAPVRLALQQLGVTSAWMLGDTPDDATAASGAGVLPIAVMPPGSGEVLREGLKASTAAVILDSLGQLERYLP